MNETQNYFPPLVQFHVRDQNTEIHLSLVVPNPRTRVAMVRHSTYLGKLVEMCSLACVRRLNKSNWFWHVLMLIRWRDLYLFSFAGRCSFEKSSQSTSGMLSESLVSLTGKKSNCWSDGDTACSGAMRVCGRDIILVVQHRLVSETYVDWA